MPNKEGGYAPNYTPTCLTDGAKGFIVDSNVLGCINETSELIPAVDRPTDMLGEKPDNVLTDSGNAACSCKCDHCQHNPADGSRQGSLVI